MVASSVVMGGDVAVNTTAGLDNPPLLRVLAANPKQINLHWKDFQNQPYSYFSRLKKALNARGKNVLAMMNAGIYNRQFGPAGLHVENGLVLAKLNTAKKGYGNFHLQPNGVFLIDDKKRAHILITKAFMKHYRGREKRLDVATQSGPMLVIDGQVNAVFLKKSRSRYSRNAVCLTRNNQLYFVITDGHQNNSNFYQFAQALKALGCYNALYLDGNISKLYLKGKNSSFHLRRYVGILSVTE